MPSVANLAISVTARTQAFERGMQRSARSLKRFQERTTTAKLALRQLGSAFMGSKLFMGGAVLAGIGLAMREAMRRVEEFNQSMNQSLAIMGDVSDMMRKDMAGAALEVAKTTRFMAKDLAASYYYLASAGMTAKQSLLALPVVAQFAQAGMFDLSRATDLLTDAQTAMALTSTHAKTNLENMTRVADVLVKANTMANASVEQFSQALTTKAAAAARNIGMEIEEVVSVLAVFADQGLKGADAGTAFTIALRDLTEKALKNKQAFREHGITVYDLANEFRGMGNVIGDLERAFEGMSDAKRKQAFMDMGFTAKSISATESLLGTTDKMRSVYDGLMGAMGETERVGTKQLTMLAKSTQAWEAQKTAIAMNTGVINTMLASMKYAGAAALGAPGWGVERWKDIWGSITGAEEVASAQLALTQLEDQLAKQQATMADARAVEMRAMREQEAQQERIAAGHKRVAEEGRKAAKSWADVIWELSESQIEHGMGAVGRAVRELATLKAPQKFIDLARDLGYAFEQREAKTAINDLIRGLQDQERATEMSRKELDLYTASMKGADEAQIRMIANTHDRIAALREQTEEERKSRAERERRLSLLDRPGEFQEIRLERFHIPGIQAMNREQLVRDPQLAGVIREQQKTREVLERGVVAVAG